jgi:hypothetical protein
LTHYQQQIPALFCFNVLLNASNGTDISISTDRIALSIPAILRKISQRNEATQNG